MMPVAKGISYQGKLVNDLGHKGTTGSNKPKGQGPYLESGVSIDTQP